METRSSATAAITALAGRPADRRLFRRYPTGLAAELVHADDATACRVSDISLGGCAVEVGEGLALPAAGTLATLVSPYIAEGLRLAVEVRQVLERRVNLAFRLDDDADFRLTMFLMDSPATLDALGSAL